MPVVPHAHMEPPVFVATTSTVVMGAGPSRTHPIPYAKMASSFSAADVFAIFDSDRDSVLKGDDFKRFATSLRWDQTVFPDDDFRREDFATMSEREYQQALNEFGVRDFSKGLSLSEFLATWSSVRVI
jgi:hypothetical protein